MLRKGVDWVWKPKPPVNFLFCHSALTLLQVSTRNGLRPSTEERAWKSLWNKQVAQIDPSSSYIQQAQIASQQQQLFQELLLLQKLIDRARLAPPIMSSTKPYLISLLPRLLKALQNVSHPGACRQPRDWTGDQHMKVYWILERVAVDEPPFSTAGCHRCCKE